MNERNYSPYLYHDDVEAERQREMQDQLEQEHEQEAIQQARSRVKPPVRKMRTYR